MIRGDGGSKNISILDDDGCQHISSKGKTNTFAITVKDTKWVIHFGFLPNSSQSQMPEPNQFDSLHVIFYEMSVSTDFRKGYMTRQYPTVVLNTFAAGMAVTLSKLL